MIRVRPKLGTERNSEWRCCFCLHVRTGTILLGSWHLLLHMLALVFLAAIVRDPHLMNEMDQDSMPRDWSNNPPLPTPLSNADMQPTTTYTQHFSQPKDHSLIYHDVDMSALVTVCTLAITLMLIYGAVRGKPAPLLPFFCLQIFDFAITILTATGYLCYLRSIHRLVADSTRVPWKQELLQLPAPALAFIVLSSFLVAVIMKGYCISIVWRCYKYLTMRAHALQSLTPFVISSESLAGGVSAPPAYAQPVPAPDYSSLLPNYEDAVKQTPPPSYRAATLMASAGPDTVAIPETPMGEQQATNVVVSIPAAAADVRPQPNAV